MTTQTSLSGRHFIDGERVGSGVQVLHSLRADSGEPTGARFFSATADEAARAAEAAQRAFPAFAHSEPEMRAALLAAIADELDALGDDFFDIAHQETALPLARLQGERARTSGQLRMFAMLLRRGDALGVRIDTALVNRAPLPRPDLRQYNLALGPVAVFGASNFPLAFSTAGGDTASALAAGCPVVVKAHPGHMATAELTGEAIARAVKACGLSGGIFNLIFGTDIGADLVQHPAVKAVGFTGSLRGGMALQKLAWQRPEPIPVFAEMSAINPLLILPEALRQRSDTLAKGLSGSFTLGAGQFCTKPGLVIAIRGEDFSAFTEALSQFVSEVPAQTMLNPQTLRHYQEKLDAAEKHAAFTRLASGKTAQPGQAQARIYQTSMDTLLANDPLLLEEIFGPATLLLPVKDEEEMLAAVTALQGQLTATVHAEADDGALAARLLPLLSEKAGRVLFDGYPTGVEVCDAMVHGGPWPATTDARGTSVGTLAIARFMRPICLQNTPAVLLPPALRDENPLNLLRLVNGQWTREAISSAVE